MSDNEEKTEEKVKVSAKLPKSLVDFIDQKAKKFNPELTRTQIIEFIIRDFKGRET